MTALDKQYVELAKLARKTLRPFRDWDTSSEHQRGIWLPVERADALEQAICEALVQAFYLGGAALAPRPDYHDTPPGI